jgi:hypothetical protein
MPLATRSVVADTWGFPNSTAHAIGRAARRAAETLSRPLVCCERWTNLCRAPANAIWAVPTHRRQQLGAAAPYPPCCTPKSPCSTTCSRPTPKC